MLRVNNLSVCIFSNSNICMFIYGLKQNFAKITQKIKLNMFKIYLNSLYIIDCQVVKIIYMFYLSVLNVKIYIYI